VKRLTVVILNWNGLADTRACLASLERCETPGGWHVELMVVDNASGDGSVEALRREFPSADVLPLDANYRYAGGNNRGIARALERGADAILLLNNDTEADPGLLARLVEVMEREHAAVAPLIHFAAPPDLIWYAGAECVPALGFAAHRGLRKRDRGQYRKVEETGYLTGCCLLAPRAAWLEVGGLDESYYIYAEDSDWSLRARAKGWKLLFVPQAKLAHKVSASSGAASPWKIYQRLRANFTLFSRHTHGIERLMWFPCFVGWQKLLFFWLLLKGEGRAAWAVPQALWDALAGRPAAEVKP
jgi:GT2 family glycosyltransferase